MLENKKEWRIILGDFLNGSSFKVQRAGNEVGGQIALDKKMAFSRAAVSHAIATADRRFLVVLRRGVIDQLARGGRFSLLNPFLTSLALVRHNLRLHFLFGQLLVLDSDVLSVHRHKAKHQEIYAGSNDGETEQDEDERQSNISRVVGQSFVVLKGDIIAKANRRERDWNGRKFVQLIISTCFHSPKQ